MCCRITRKKQDYDRASLTLLDPDSVTLDIAGELSRRDLDAMEVIHLTVTESAPGRVTGKLDLIIRDKAWTIHFTNAVWRVVNYHSIADTRPM